MDPVFSLSHMPFSRYGAYVAVSDDDRHDHLIIHNVRRRTGEDAAYELYFQKDGATLPYTAIATPWAAAVDTPAGQVRIYVRDDQTLVFESHGVDLYFNQLGRRGYGVQEYDRQYKMISVGHRIYTLFYVQRGLANLDNQCVLQRGEDPARVGADRELCVRCEDGVAVVALRMSIEEPLSLPLPIDIPGEIQGVKAEWEAFLQQMPPIDTTASQEQREFTILTWYNLWSSFVRAGDCYHYDTMLMSKKFMSSVWSWDHCFNALAMAALGPDKALEQFYAPFVIQSPTGALPDMWNPNSEIVWGVTKPPIHGWCFGKLMDKFTFPPETLKRVYGYLEKWTNWWMVYRDSDHDGVPEYPMGNDSGWDNSTVFDTGYFMESPDLSAFLILQMQTLGRIAMALGWQPEADQWNQRALKLKQDLYQHSWNGRFFVAKQSRTHAYQAEPTSLLVHMPLVLGEQLEKEKMDSMVAMLEHFLTPYGLATERPDSPCYNADGYWRGPIWAPSTYLLVDGLRRGGYPKLAETIARRYMDMSCQVARGNYENFDALTGRGLRAPGYTWSASVYMLLRWEYGYATEDLAL